MSEKNRKSKKRISKIKKGGWQVKPKSYKKLKNTLTSANTTTRYRQPITRNIDSRKNKVFRLP
jgi:hypothetical protein